MSIIPTLPGQLPEELRCQIYRRLDDVVYRELENIPTTEISLVRSLGNLGERFLLSETEVTKHIEDIIHLFDQDIRDVSSHNRYMKGYVNFLEALNA